MVNCVSENGDISMETSSSDDKRNNKKIEDEVSNLYPITLVAPTTEIIVESDNESANSTEYENCGKTVIASPFQNDHLVPPKSSTINIENSNDVVIGALTQFHGPVTIYQNINPDNQNAGNNLENEENPNLYETKSAKLNPNKDLSLEKQDSTSSAQTVTSPTTLQWIISHKKLIIFGVVCFVLLISVAIFLVLINEETKEEDISNNEGENEDDNKLEHHKMYSREEWGGREPLNFTKPLRHPIDYVIISHTAGGLCKNFQKCRTIVQLIQDMHVSELGSPDIGYNFLIGGDGDIYVGRNWDTKNFHRDNNIGISYIGNYVYDELTPRMISALEELLALGVKNKKLASDYKLVCHNQTSATLSPGQNVYKVIAKFPHFYPGTI